MVAEMKERGLTEADTVAPRAKQQRRIADDETSLSNGAYDSWTVETVEKLVEMMLLKETVLVKMIPSVEEIVKRTELEEMMTAEVKETACQ